MSITVKRLETGDLLISCGGEEIVYLMSPGKPATSADARPPLITFTPRPPGSGYSTYFGTGRSGRKEPDVSVGSVGDLDAMLDALSPQGKSRRKALRIGWHGPFEIAEVKQAIERRTDLNFNIEIAPLKTSTS